MILADKIIRLRKKHGWSQEELAEKMQVSRQAVSKWEGAQTMPEDVYKRQGSSVFTGVGKQQKPRINPLTETADRQTTNDTLCGTFLC